MEIGGGEWWRFQLGVLGGGVDLEWFREVDFESVSGFRGVDLAQKADRRLLGGGLQAGEQRCGIDLVGWCDGGCRLSPRSLLGVFYFFSCQ